MTTDKRKKNLGVTVCRVQQGKYVVDWTCTFGSMLRHRRFHIGPDWDRKKEAEWYAQKFREALAEFSQWHKINKRRDA